MFILDGIYILYVKQ